MLLHTIAGTVPFSFEQIKFVWLGNISNSFKSIICNRINQVKVISLLDKMLQSNYLGQENIFSELF